MAVGTTDDADDPVRSDAPPPRRFQLARSLLPFGSTKQQASTSDALGTTPVTRPGCSGNRVERTVPVKARITLLAVVLGAVLLALVLADGPWPGVH
jgi:hypothetical protein